MTARNKAEIKAKQILFKRKLSAEESARNTAAKIFAEHPDVLELKKQKDELSSAVFPALVTGNEQLKSELTNAVKAKNAEITALLQKYDLAPDALDIKYHCRKCNDSGYVGGVQCDCMKELVDGIVSAEFAPSSVYKNCSFDTFDISYYPEDKREYMRSVLEFCKEYSRKFKVSDQRGILLMGNTGLGKTHLAVSLSGEIADKGYYVICATAQEVLRRVEDDHFGRTNDRYIDELYACDLLVLDDLGAEFVTSFAASAVYDIINTRIISGKPTVITTNLNVEDLRRRYADRVVSRIAYYFDMFNIVGSDIRMLKRKYNV